MCLFLLPLQILSKFFDKFLHKSLESCSRLEQLIQQKYRLDGSFTTIFIRFLFTRMNQPVLHNDHLFSQFFQQNNFGDRCNDRTQGKSNSLSDNCFVMTLKSTIKCSKDLAILREIKVFLAESIMTPKQKISLEMMRQSNS